jgi:hypothetical protein
MWNEYLSSFKNPLNNPLEKISLSVCKICECWLCFVYPAGIAFEGTYMREKLKPNEVEFLSQNVKKSSLL